MQLDDLSTTQFWVKVFKVLLVISTFIILFSFVNVGGKSLSYDILGYDTVTISNDDRPTSMYPSIKRGDSFFVIKSSWHNLDSGDLIVFENKEGLEVLHRLVDKLNIDGHFYLIVKGDNPHTNFLPDDGLVSMDKFIGKVVFQVPIYGKFVMAFNHEYNTFFSYMVISAISLFTVLNLFNSTSFILHGDKNTNNKNKNKQNNRKISDDISVFIDNFRLLPRKILTHKRRIFYIPMIILFLIYLTISLSISTPYIQDGQTRVKDVSATIETIIINDLPELDTQFSYYFVQLSIDIFESTSIFDKIDSIEVSLLYNNNTISLSSYSHPPSYSVSGSYVLGIGLIIHEDSIDQSEITVQANINLNLNFLQNVHYSKLLVLSFH